MSRRPVRSAVVLAQAYLACSTGRAQSSTRGSSLSALSWTLLAPYSRRADPTSYLVWDRASQQLTSDSGTPTSASPSPRHSVLRAASASATAGACRPAVDRSSERTVQRRSKAPLPPSSTGTGTGTTPGVSRSARTGCQQQSATHRSVEGCVAIHWTAGAGIRDFRIRLIRSAGKARPPVSTFTRTPYAVQAQAQSDQAQQTGCLQPSSSTCQRLCPEASLARVDLRCITACPGTAAGPPCGTIDSQTTPSAPAAQKRLFAGAAQIGWSGMCGRIARPRHCYGGVHIAALDPIHSSSALPLQGWQRSSSLAGSLAACHNGPPPRRPLLQFRQGLDRTGVDRCLTHLVGNGLVTVGLSTDDATA